MDLEQFEYFLRDLEYFDNFLGNKWCLQMQTIHEALPNCNGRLNMPLRRRFNPFFDLDETEFRHKYRFSKDNMRKIIEMIRDDLEMDRPLEQCTNQVPVELQIMAAIRFWGGSEALSATAAAHGVSFKTLAKICRRVAGALAAKASRYIRMPATLAEKERVTNAFEVLSGMPQVIGAVAHHKVQVTRSTTEDREQLHIQIVCDANLRICDHDCKIRSTCEPNYEIFAQSRIKERFEQNEFRGRILLGNETLNCTSFLFTPIQGDAAPECQAFNHSHAMTFRPAIKCLELWSKRFGVLESGWCTTFGPARQTIVALALLHNMAIEWNDEPFGGSSNEMSKVKDERHFGIISETLNAANVDSSARNDFIKHNFVNKC